MYHKSSILFYYIVYSVVGITLQFYSHLYICHAFIQHIPAQLLIYYQNNSPLKQKPYIENTNFKSVQLQGTIIPTSVNFFTKAGLSLGLAHSLSRSISRLLIENIAWKKRCEISSNRTHEIPKKMRKMRFMYTQRRKTEEYGMMEKYKSTAIENNKNRRIECECITSNHPYNYTQLNSHQIREFEEKYSIPYDPYYDEPYLFDRLPKVYNYTVDKLYGDIHYNNGEVFYRDVNSSKSLKEGLYWRQGGRPRINFLGIF